jgi:hypothetical protein
VAFPALLLVLSALIAADGSRDPLKPDGLAEDSA